ncbi:MAG: sulfatase family protein [Acidobacteriota bacterium]
MATAAILLLILVGSAPGGEVQAQERPPNILLITTDHMRVDNIAANGAPWMRTPSLDRLVREGMSFKRAFINGIACSPSRASLMTGRYPRHHGVRTNGIPLPEDEITLTHVLREAGYYTGQFGKLHFWPHSGDRNHRGYHPPYGFHEMQIADEPGCYDDAYGRWLWTQGKEAREAGRVMMPAQRTGFDYYTFAGEDRLTHAWWAADQTIGFIERNSGRSWFAHLGFYAPHPPLNPPASQLERYQDVEIPRRSVQPEEMESMPGRYQRTRQRRAEISERQWDEYRRHFYAMVSNVDVQVERVLEALQENGSIDNTLIILTSDHGDYLGDHGINGKSTLIYDQVYNVPLIFWGAGLAAREPTSALVELVDVMPTVLEFLGLPLPLGIRGRSFLPVLQGQGNGREFIYAEHPEMRMVRTAEAKYGYHPDGEVLFDLGADPGEHRNLIDDPTAKALLDRMRALLRLKEFDLWDDLPQRIAPY